MGIQSARVVLAAQAADIKKQKQFSSALQHSDRDTETNYCQSGWECSLLISYRRLTRIENVGCTKAAPKSTGLQSSFNSFVYGNHKAVLSLWLHNNNNNNNEVLIMRGPLFLPELGALYREKQLPICTHFPNG